MSPPRLLLRSTIFMDAARQSPIGAWATPFKGDVPADEDLFDAAGKTDSKAAFKEGRPRRQPPRQRTHRDAPREATPRVPRR